MFYLHLDLVLLAVRSLIALETTAGTEKRGRRVRQKLHQVSNTIACTQASCRDRGGTDPMARVR